MAALLRRLNYYSRLRRVVAHLQEHPTEPIPLVRAAEIACMERTSFSRFFSRAAGLTFRDFMQQWRISVAIERIFTSDSSFTEIAFAAGFESISAFERTFKKVTSLSPSQYRKHLLAKKWPVPEPAIPAINDRRLMANTRR